MLKQLLLGVMIVFLAGCSHVISDSSLRMVDRSLNFAQVKENPDQYMGKYLLLGGAIVSVSNGKDGGRLEVVQYHLDSEGMPMEADPGGGRFLARSSRFLDPMIYKVNRLVTIVGEVTGHRKLPLDETEYDYPVIAIRELHIWKQPVPYYYNYPYPYPYYYPYDYWWWRPYRPWPHRH